MRESVAHARRLWMQPWRASALAGLGYLVATIWMTWPLVRHAGSAVQDLGDPIFEIWVMRWVQHALANRPLDLYHANAFHPFSYSLAYSEEAISTALLAWPVYLVTGNDVLAYNVLFLGSFWLMGFAIYLLAREFGAWPGAAFVAGLIAAFAPARFGHVSHLHLLAFGWLPMTLWALLRLWRSGKSRYALEGGICLQIQLFASLHLAVYSSLALALFIPLMMWSERGPAKQSGGRSRVGQRRDGRTNADEPAARPIRLAAAVAVPYLLFLPTLIPHLRAGERYGFERTRAEVAALAAQPADFFSVFVTNEVLGVWLRTTTEPFFPGFVALVGLAMLVALRRWSWPLTFAVVLTLIGGVLALGFEVRLGDWQIPLPYAAIYDLAPPVRAVRGVARFGLLTTIGVPLLAAFGFTALWVRLRTRLPHAASLGFILTLLLALVVCVELRSRVGVTHVPNSAEEMAVYSWLARQPPGPVAEFPADGALREPLEPIWYMYGSTRHWLPVLAGYSGYLPPGHVELQRHLQGADGYPSMVTADNAGLLQDIGITYIVIHRRPGYDWQTALDAAQRIPELELLADLGDSVVYRLGAVMRPAVQLAASSTVHVAATGGLASLALELRNPRATPAIVNLDGTLDVKITRTRLSDNTKRHETVELSVPFIMGPGNVTLPLRLDAPDEPGDYRYDLRIPALGAELTQQMSVLQLLDSLSQPQVAVELVAEDPAGHCSAGETPMVVVWTALRRLAEDYAATVQLVSGEDHIVGQVDAMLSSQEGTTGSWSVGRRQRTALCLPTGDALPDDYELVIAMYSTEPGLPRIPLLLPNGAISQEYRQAATPLESP